MRRDHGSWSYAVATAARRSSARLVGLLGVEPRPGRLRAGNAAITPQTRVGSSAWNRTTIARSSGAHSAIELRNQNGGARTESNLMPARDCVYSAAKAQPSLWRAPCAGARTRYRPVIGALPERCTAIVLCERLAESRVVETHRLLDRRSAQQARSATSPIDSPCWRKAKESNP